MLNMTRFFCVDDVGGGGGGSGYAAEGIPVDESANLADIAASMDG